MINKFKNTIKYTVAMLTFCIGLNQEVKAMTSFDENLKYEYYFIQNESLRLNFNNNEYLSLTLSNKNVLNIKTLIENEEKKTLIDRGEAHITVFQPSDFKKISAFLSLEDIKNEVFDFKWKINCLGRGIKDQMSTYFIIVDSDDIVYFRNRLLKLAETKAQYKIEVDVFRPHITVGFTHRDLHVQDGIDKSICWK